MNTKKRIGAYCGLSIILFAALAYVFSGPVLTWIGKVIVLDEEPVCSDVVVVLNTGLEYYPRLIQAAKLYGRGFSEKIVINGNRKSRALRELEEKGFQSCCSWYEDRVRILELLGVPREHIVTISAEDVYDTVSEAKAVGSALKKAGVSSIIITTSKFHSRRACHIWRSIFQNQFIIRSVAAETDPYSPRCWWKSGRQIRWVLAEYGAWVYYFWKILL